MKKVIIASLLALSAMFAGTGRSHAQTYVPASLPDQFVYPAESWLNSAALNYAPNCTGSCGISQLKVVAWGAGGLAITDGLGAPAIVTLPAGATQPAVVLGNDISSPSLYLMGVTYLIGSTVRLSIYKVANVGTGGPLSVGVVGIFPVSPGTISITGFPRIDIIADYSSPFLGLPLCNKFVITYSDNYNVFSYYSSLNTPTVSSLHVIATGNKIYPDVAAIRRLVGSTINDIALFTYLDYVANILYYQEYNLTTGVISAPIVLDNANTPGKLPKIVAIDDYHLNSPSGSLAYFNVVDNNMAETAVRIYNNRLPVNGVEITAPFISPSAFKGWPVEVVGPCKAYTVSWPTAFGQPDVLTVNVDWGTGLPFGYPATTYYEVNKNPATALDALITSASTCNAVDESIKPYIFWWWNENSTNDIYTKYTDCSMSLRPEESAAATTIQQWILSPNPASDMLTLAGSNIAQGDAYRITDLTGRQMSAAVITSGSQQIDISRMAPGMYLLSITSNGRMVKTIKFVKQ